MNKRADFYLGANTADGFISMFDRLYDETADDAVIIKGGSGTGKSTLMKKIASLAESENIGLVEHIHCSSDPDSLDAVIFRDGKCCILDGTAPHTTDPRWPGAVDRIVNLGDNWDGEKLRAGKAKIVEITKRKKKIYGEVYRYIAAATDACDEIRSIAGRFVKSEKLSSDIQKTVSRDFPPTKGLGKETERVLYSVTPKGYFGFDGTLTAFCDGVTAIDDDFCTADIYLNALKAGATENGYDVIVCKNCLNFENGIDALIVPGKRAFVTSTFLREYGGEKAQTVNMKNYLNMSELRNYKARLSFNRKLAKEMLDRAVDKLNEIRELHGILENIYISAMDFEKVNRLSNEVIASFGL